MKILFENLRNSFQKLVKGLTSVLEEWKIFFKDTILLNGRIIKRTQGEIHFSNIIILIENDKTALKKVFSVKVPLIKRRMKLMRIH